LNYKTITITELEREREREYSPEENREFESSTRFFESSIEVDCKDGDLRVKKGIRCLLVRRCFGLRVKKVVWLRFRDR